MIYMDNAATTRMSERAFEAMRPYFMEQYANAAGTYSFAAGVSMAVDNARGQLAKVIGAKANEIYFTCGGTESDNWALKGVMQANPAKGKHLIISAIEHHAILHTAETLKKQGCEVTILPVDEFGMVSVDELEKAIRPDTVLVSIMAANNEIGTVQPIEKIGAVCDEILEPDMTKEQQLRAVYRYVYDHIAYVSDSDKSDWVRAAYDGLFVAGAGDCFNYAAAAQAFCAAGRSGKYLSHTGDAAGPRYQSRCGSLNSKSPAGACGKSLFIR